MTVVLATFPPSVSTLGVGSVRRSIALANEQEQQQANGRLGSSTDCFCRRAATTQPITMQPIAKLDTITADNVPPQVGWFFTLCCEV